MAALLINCPATLSFCFKATKFHPKFKSQSNIRPQIINCNLEQPARRSANYQPSLWSDDYIQSLPTSCSMAEQNNERIQMLKKEVVQLIHENKDMKSQLQLIDELEQLGVAYHFKEEIDDALWTISTKSSENIAMAFKDDLYATGLAFRLLRQHGLDVSEDIFRSYTEKNGTFIPSLKKDTKGILSLYEASYLAKHGERLLDGARVFTTTQLRHLLGGSLQHYPRVSKHVAYALELPLDWRMKRLHSRWFIEACKEEELMNPILRELAILDYNDVQLKLRKEMKTASRWWKNLGVAKKLSFSRDRLMENYFWSFGFASDPQHGGFREASVKTNCFITTIDDIYDLYGTLDELELFTSVINSQMGCQCNLQTSRVHANMLLNTIKHN